MKINRIFILLLVAFFSISCEGIEKSPVFKPGSSQVPEEEEADTTVTEEPSVTPPGLATGAKPDYSLLTAANHPRIIFKQSDFDGIKAAMTADSPLSTICKGIISQADGSLSKADLTYTLSGKRLLSVSRDAMQRLLSCAFAYKVTGDKEYLDNAVHNLKTVCNFPDWNAKKHWLDVGEMATGVALAYDWLYNELDDATKAAVVTAIKNFCFAPANNKEWNLNFYSSTSNWNQVCNGGIIAAALAIFEKESSCQAMIEKSIDSNVIAVEAMYSPDGNYPEGYSYWNYGTGYQALINTMLHTATGSDAGLSKKDGFSRTGKYMLFMEGPTQMCFNYSDCASGARPCLPQWYFAWWYNDTSHLYLEKNRLASYGGSEEARLITLVAYHAYKLNIASLNDINPPTSLIWKGEGTTPVVLAHSNWNMDATDKFLGIKGGRAYTSHAHMDAGSFVYDAFGVRWAADFGLQSYGTLEPYINLWNMNDGSERWDVFRYKNTSHNTITINNAPHKVSGAADIVAVLSSSGKLGGAVDMTQAVRDQAARVVRTIYIEGDDLVVQDEITALANKDANVRWNMVTYAKPTIEYGNITLQYKDKYLYMKKSSSTGHNVAWKTWSTEGEHSWDASNKGMYMCGYEFTVKAGATANVTIRLTPKE